MIIEDEPDAAEMFAEMMSVNGFSIIKMFSSAPAIPFIIQEKPDLIILDLMFLDISGLAADASVFLSKPVDFLDQKQAAKKVM
ncbi:MAG: hypothetical protein Q8O48_02000 [Anaerolineales bacterium]|nr:hypothetical protein [Anaerolineales bacterium]